VAGFEALGDTMVPMNRMQIAKLCEQIGELVGDQELNLSFTRGNARISVVGGKQAEQEEAFMKAVGNYLLATRHHGGDAADAREKFDRALALWLESIKL
jgi:hypothetical protein